MNLTAELAKTEAETNAFRLAREVIEVAVKDGKLECYVQGNDCNGYVMEELGKLGYRTSSSGPYTGFNISWS